MNRFDLAFDPALLALVVSLVAGGLCAAVVRAGVRTKSVVRRSRTRYALRLALLAALALAVPGCFVAGAIARARIPAVRIAAPPASAIARPASLDAPAAPRTTGAEPFVPRVSALPQPAVSTHRIDLSLAIAALWLAGVLVSSARVAIGMLRLRRIVSEAAPAGMRRIERGPVRILASERFGVPIALGYLRPSVMLPRALLARESCTDIENVVLHELEHLRRFDDLTTLLQAVCLGLLWFNPFAYALARRLTDDREMACDEAVVERTGKRAGYAATLWKLALDAADGIPHAATAFASGARTIGRMDNLLAARPKAAPPALHRIALAVGVAAPFALLATAAVAPAMLLAPPGLTGYAIAHLCCGQSLVVGGRTATGEAVARAQLYDAAGNRLAIVTLPVSRWAAAATALADGNVLVTGGMTDAGATADAELYLARSRRFVRVAPMRWARAGHTATLLPDGTVVVAGGERAPDTYVSETETYRPARRDFVYSGEGEGRTGQTALLVDGGRVLMLGKDRTGRECDFIYDPTRGVYKTAGTFVRSGPGVLTFVLPGGKLVRYRIVST